MDPNDKTSIYCTEITSEYTSLSPAQRINKLYNMFHLQAKRRRKKQGKYHRRVVRTVVRIRRHPLQTKVKVVKTKRRRKNEGKRKNRRRKRRNKRRKVEKIGACKIVSYTLNSEDSNLGSALCVFPQNYTLVRKCIGYNTTSTCNM